MSARASHLQKPRLPASGPATNRTLDSRLSYWMGWSIRARCGHPDCPPNRLIEGAEVMTARGDVTAGEMADRMHCDICRQPATGVAFVRPRKSGDRVIHRVKGSAFL